MIYVRFGALAFALGLVMESAAWAFPTYLAAWEARYPDSTLPARMAVATGADCHVCHHPPSRGLPGNCYREAIISLLDSGLSIEEALEQLDSEDSDGDGVANGAEIMAAHVDFAGEVGYNPGLVGPNGTDPCSGDPNEVVTGALETPFSDVPTVSEWGLVVLVLLLASAGHLVIRQRVQAR